MPSLLLFHPTAHPFPSARGSTATRLAREGRHPQAEEDKGGREAEQTCSKDSSAQRRRELRVPGSSGRAQGVGAAPEP